MKRASPVHDGRLPGEAARPSGGGTSSDIAIRALEAGEGAKLVACLRRCYGESHVDPGLYDAAAIDAALASGRRHSAVAVTPEGEVVGHIGIAMRRPGDDTADVGLTLVDPRHRGRGLARRLSLEIGRMAQRMGLIGLHDYPVTVHGATQRLAAERDGRRRISKIAVSAAGRSTAALEREALRAGEGLRAVQIDLPLRDRHVPRLAERLRGIGFFFGALLPEFRDGDVLRLQRLASSPAARAVPVLESTALREIADFVLRDAAEVSPSGARDMFPRLL